MNTDLKWRYLRTYRYHSQSPKFKKLLTVIAHSDSKEVPTRHYQSSGVYVLASYNSQYNKLDKSMAVSCAQCDNAKCHFSIVTDGQNNKGITFAKRSMDFLKGCPRQPWYTEPKPKKVPKVKVGGLTIGERKLGLKRNLLGGLAAPAIK